MYVLINPGHYPDLKKRITSSEYYSLPLNKQKYYYDEDASSITENNSILDSSDSLFSGFDSDFSSDSSDSSFGGFDGGDTGGGGAGGDW
jgi:uncharacterized membrane protein YgcG